MNLSKESKMMLITELLGVTPPQNSCAGFWQLGEDYVIRTVTMIYLGKLKAVNDKELLLEDCAWIPDTSRWNEFLSGSKPSEMEPYQNDVIIGRSALLDATVMKTKIKREIL